MIKRKLVTVKDSGPIPELNFVTGPISRPTEIALSSIIKMISNGRKVFECNPANHCDMVELSLANVKKDNFVNTKPASSVSVEKDEETPSVPPVDEVKDEPSVEEKKEEIPEETPVEKDEETPSVPPVDEVKDEPSVEEKKEETSVEKKDVKQPQKNNKNKNNHKNGNRK